MPLVKLFARTAMPKTIPLAALQSRLCEIWGTTPSTTKLLLVRCEDWTDESFQEDVYVDIRAYGTCVLYPAIETCVCWILLVGPTLANSFVALGPQQGKAERTREFVLDGMSQIQKAFQDHNLTANLRLETYDGERYFHVPPPK